jgi:hypothetical protein
MANILNVALFQVELNDSIAEPQPIGVSGHAEAERRSNCAGCDVVLDDASFNMHAAFIQSHRDKKGYAGTNWSGHGCLIGQASNQTPVPCQESMVAREAHLDIVCGNSREHSVLKRRSSSCQHAIDCQRVRTIGSRPNRTGLGTVVRIKSSSGTQWQTVHSGSSYASHSELTLTFGFGRDARVAAIPVQWPSGQTESFANLAPIQVVVIDEQRGSIK